MPEMPAPTENLLSSVLCRLDYAVLVFSEGNSFHPAGELPDWFEPVFGDAQEPGGKSPFLESFLETEFEEWSREPGETISSGLWEENSPEGFPRYFEAMGMKAGQDRLLLIRIAEEQHRNEQAFIQSAHDQRLDQRKLFKELEKKQILLECIMHDLGNPLSTVLMNLQHLGRKLDKNRELLPAIKRATAQAERQRMLIRSIADVFEADLAAMGSALPGDEQPPDLAAVASETVAACTAAASEKSVTLCPLFVRRCLVVGNRLHLSRVIENLLLNAIRHSPEGGRVLVSFDEEGAFAKVRIEDEGPGIDEGKGVELFKPFAQGAENTGQSGLGLYFCRMTVEMWGGKIAAGNRQEGGAWFEFQLPKVEG